jgi:hypothetical protein
MKKTKIYLVENCYGDPNKVYIGKTKNSRKNDHERTYGRNIIYTIIDEINSLDRKDWKPLESYWIEQFRQWGFDIVNIQKKGGSGPEFVTEYTKNKIREGNLGKKKPGVSHKLKGRKSHHRENTGLKISDSKKNMKLTEEWKSKISNSTKGNKNRLGCKTSQLTKEKIGNALRGRKRPEDVIQKMKKPKSSTINFGKHRKGIKVAEKTILKQKKSMEKFLKPVLQFDKQGNFIKEHKGVRIAAKNTKCYDSSIVLCCQGKLKSTKGFIFKYK